MLRAQATFLTALCAQAHPKQSPRGGSAGPAQNMICRFAHWKHKSGARGLLYQQSRLEPRLNNSVVLRLLSGGRRLTSCSGRISWRSVPWCWLRERNYHRSCTPEMAFLSCFHYVRRTHTQQITQNTQEGARVLEKHAHVHTHAHTHTHTHGMCLSRSCCVTPASRTRAHTQTHTHTCW